MSKFFALWVTARGPAWDGPFDTNTEARKRVPGNAAASIITKAIPMTPGERLEALPILDGVDAEAEE